MITTNLIKQFYDDIHTREAVKEFFNETLNKLALERVYKKEETMGIADAKEVIELAFIELRNLYENKKEKEVLGHSE